MGYPMPMHNTGEWVAKVGRDGREFSHVVENLRDSLLAEAKNVWFSIYGPQYGETDCVAKRVITDDGTGMSYDTLATAYSGFGLSRTTTDFATDLDLATGEIKIAVAKITEAASVYHSRNGVGGRGSLSHWNKLGVVTITAHEGIPYMIWSYRDGQNELQCRTWINDDGVRTHIIAPYSEPDFWTKEDMAEDMSFATMALYRDGQFSTEDAARKAIAKMADDEAFPNPLAGYEWDNGIVPKWAVARYEDGVALTPDGERAHFTCKVLLGDHPKDHTGLIGDPSFTNEASYSRYHGAGNHFFLDLSRTNVNIQVLHTEVASKPSFTLHGLKGRYRFESGTPDSHALTNPNAPGKGRRQMGAARVRMLPTEEEVEAAAKKKITIKSPVKSQIVLDLSADGFGKALLIFREPEKGLAGKDFWHGNRDGVIAAVYRNEVHGINSDDVDTSDWQFRSMGIPTFTEVRGRVSVFWFPPMATDTVDGVFQNVSRDRLRWKGRDDLPLTGDRGLNAAIQRALEAQHPEFLAAIFAEMKSNKAKIDMTKVRKLWAAVGSLGKAARELREELGEKDKTEENALIEEEDAANPGETAGNGAPRAAERPDVICEYGCTGKYHAIDCPNRSKGGGDGPRKPIKLAPTTDGKQRGRTSRAKVTVAEPEAPKPKEPDAPQIILSKDLPVLDSPLVPAVYTPTELPKTGVLQVNEDHFLVTRLFGLVHEKLKGYTPVEVDQYTREWIEAELSKVILGTLSMADQKQYGKEKESYTVLADHLLANDVWVGVLGGFLFRDESLISYVRNKASRRATRTSKAA